MFYFVSIGEEGANGCMFNCSFVAYKKIAAYKCKNFLVFQNVILWKT
jgi:hypothetical protein